MLRKALTDGTGESCKVEESGPVERSDKVFLGGISRVIGNMGAGIFNACLGICVGQFDWKELCYYLMSL